MMNNQPQNEPENHEETNHDHRPANPLRIRGNENETAKREAYSAFNGDNWGFGGVRSQLGDF